MDAPKEKEENFFKEILKASLIALIIVLPIRFYVAQPFIVSGASMDPTFENGHYIIVDQLSFRLGEPERGNVVIFKFPNDPSKFFIKRVIGLPGEIVLVDRGEVKIVNGVHPNGFLIKEPYVHDLNKTQETFKVILEDDQYFVLGDNRRASSDSRVWGPLERDLIVGRAFFRILPISDIGVLPGNFTEEYVLK
jgi:signal peptidase I